jgi:4-amino-4-deoxy-L-arabinose transferase-like glycosyltransferase
LRAAPASTLALTLVAYATLVYGYITLTPVWQNPDEPAHYNYVAFVARTGGLPELKPGDWNSALLDRLKNSTLQPGDSVGSIQYENWQPPLFYLLATPVFRAGSIDDAQTVLVRLRVFDAALGALTLVTAFFVGRTAFSPDRVELAAAVPLTLVGVPMFTAVSAALSADPLANLVSAVLVLVLVQRVRRADATMSAHWALLTGVLIGLGLLTKLSLAIFVPLAVGVIVARSAWPVREAALMLGVAALLTLPWSVHQVTTYGWADPLALTRHSAIVADQPRFPGLSPDYVGQFLTITFHSFWAQFGWMAIVAQPRLYLIWGLLTLAAVVGLLIDRGRLVEPAWILLLATFFAGCIAYLGYNVAFEQFQGRYLFPAVVPIAMLLVAGWAAMVPRRLNGVLTIAIGVLLIALNTYALLRVLVPGFAPTG